MIIFQDDGSPYSTRFDDIYFDTSAGYQQSQTVFVDGNHISERLKNVTKNFTIAETGFGSGLNFLLTLQAYQNLFENDLDSAPTLVFISTEKYPLSIAQLEKTLALWPQYQKYSTPLLTQYPDFTDQNIADASYIGKCSQLKFFNNKVQLQLYFDDAAQAFANIRTSKHRTVDAWYLDGFSPSKNPDMWSKALFEQIERLSKDQASLATFTTSGMVKRLLTSHGFRVNKKSSEGKKAEFTQALFQQSTTLGKGYQIRPQIIKPQHVAIVGGGIASACAAYALTQQGVKVTLYCKDNTVAQGASSNDIGALYPLLHQQKDNISEFYQQAFWRAKSLYQSLSSNGFHFDHQWCGLLEVSYKDSLKKRQHLFEQLAAWPDKLIHSVDAKQASERANIKLLHGGLFMPEAGWICPPDLVKQLFEAAKKTNRLRIETGCHIKHIQKLDNGKWQLTADRKTFIESILVICGGADSIKLEIANELPLTSVRGQITSMKPNSTIENLATVICHKGYLTPANKGIHCIGATFDKNSFDCDTNHEDDLYNLSMLEQCLPDVTHWQVEDIKTSKARLRCMTPDHLPMVGPMPNINEHIEQYSHLRTDKNWRYNTKAPIIDNLYVLTGLGARGLCSAPLLADILTADICGTPYPLDNEKLFNLSPNRFVIRDLIKRKV